MRTAAHFAEAARQGMFHGRSLSLAALLEADARAALGQTERAAALYRRLLTPDAFAAGDLETWAVVQGDAVRGLERLGARGGKTTDETDLRRGKHRPAEPGAIFLGEGFHPVGAA